MVGEMLLTVQNTSKVDLQSLEELKRLLGVHHFEAEEISRRDGGRSIAGRLRCLDVAIDGIAFAKRVEEIAQAAWFNAGTDGRKTAPNRGAVDHFPRPARRE
jgi:hypothetical protein